MRWHIELAIEAILFGILWAKPAPRWFCVLIGCDFVAGLLQLLPYRLGLQAHSALIWEAGVVLSFPLGYKSLVEAQTSQHQPFWHLRLLSVWICGQLMIGLIQSQALSAAIYQSMAHHAEAIVPHGVVVLNHVKLVLDAFCFLCWISIFLI